MVRSSCYFWMIMVGLFIGCVALVTVRAQCGAILHVRTYKKAVSTLESGSVVLLSPRRNVRAMFEKCVCGTPVTHVGIVCVDAKGVPFLFHTLRSTGAHLEPLVSWVERMTRHGSAQVFVRRLGCSRPLDKARVELAFSPYIGMKYSFTFWKAVMQSWWPGMEMPRAPPDGTRDRFCSELVADVLTRLGVLNFEGSELCARLVLPSDFWSTSRLPFSPGHTLLAPEELFISSHTA